jgi:hypothetical protein
MISNSGFQFLFISLISIILFCFFHLRYCICICMCVRAFSIVHTSDTHTHIYFCVLWSFIVFSLWLVRLPPQLSKRSVIDIPKNYVHQWTEHDKPSRRWSQNKKSKVEWKRIKLQIYTSTKLKKEQIYTHISYFWTEK